MRTPSTGRGLHPKVTAATMHLWPLDDLVIGLGSQDIADPAGALQLTGGLGDPTIAEGNIGKAFEFGTGKNVEGPTGDHIALLGAFSFDAWVYLPLGTAGPIGAYSFFPPSQVEAENTLFEITVQVDGTLKWRYERGLGAGVLGVTIAKIPTERWVHVAVVMADSGGLRDVHIYINGDFVESFTGNPLPTGGSSSRWWLGRNDIAEVFSGRISSVRVTLGSLSAAEIREAFRRGMAWEPAPMDTRLKVVVEQSPSGPGFIEVNLSDFRGRDWVQSVEISDTVDSANATASIRISRDIFNLESMAPLMMASPDNLVGGTPGPPSPAEPGPDDLTYLAAVDLWHTITVYAARMPEGSEPAKPLDFQPIFSGRIDKIDWASDSVGLACRDKTADLTDSWILGAGSWYGSDAGLAMETVMQDILNAEAPGVAVWAPVSPGFLITSYQQKAEPIIDSLRAMADLIGWAIRYRWSEDNQEFRLTLYDPDRDRLSVDGVFSADDYYAIDRLDTDLTGVRNVVRIAYEDANGAIKDVTRYATDIPPFTSTSIADYGDRWMSVADKSVIHIDTLLEATTMADAILVDLMEPYANQGAKMRSFWEVGVGDRVRFEPNDVHYSEALYGAVFSVRHRFEAGVATTSVDLRGKPASAHNRHLEKGSGPRTGVYVAPKDLSSVLVGLGDRTKRIPTEAMVAQGLTSPLSSDAAVVTPNPYFSIHIDYDNRPFDGWAVDGSSSWGVGGDVYWSTTDHESGDRSLTLLTPGAAVVSVIFQPVIMGHCMDITARWFGSKVTDNLVAEVQFFDASRVAISTSTAFSAFPVSIGVFQTNGGKVSPPATARFAKIRLSQGSGVSGDLTIDRVAMTPTTPAFFVYLPASQTAIAAGTVELVQLDDTAASAYDYCGNFDAAAYKFTAPEAGLYVFNGKLSLEGNPGSVKIDNGSCFLYKNGASWLDVMSISLAGGGSRDDIQLSWSTPPIELLGGDEITMLGTVAVDDFNIIGGIDKTWMAGGLHRGRYS